MPPRGQMKALSTSLPPARRELAQVVRTLLHGMDESLRSVGRQIHSSRSALNRLASGKFLTPDAETVLELQGLAERKERAGAVTVSYLERLLQCVRDEYESTAAAAGPAADIVPCTRGGAPAALAAGTGAPSVTPVPAAEGDRRNGSVADPQWPVDELMLHMDSGRYEHAVGMLDYAGDEAPAVESAAAIQACRSRGLTEATDALLRKVGSRPEKVVFAVVVHLIDVGNVTDSRALAALRS